MTAHDSEITLRAVRTNWPLLVTAALGLIWAIRGEMTIAQNEGRIAKLETLVSVEGISEYAANTALVNYRLDQLEKGQ